MGKIQITKPLSSKNLSWLLKERARIRKKGFHVDIYTIKTRGDKSLINNYILMETINGKDNYADTSFIGELILVPEEDLNEYKDTKK